jgi:hypothetical protein
MPRSTRHALALAARSAIPAYFYAPDPAGDDTAKGGAADDKTKGKAGDKGTADQPKKIELTEDELAARIKSETEAALNKERTAAADKAKKEKEEADRKKAEEQGEFKTLADKAEEKRLEAERERDAAKLETRKLAVKDQLRDYLAEKHPQYASSARWIMPAIEFDLATDDKDIAKRIAAAADEYVKDNPRQAGPGGAPGQIGRNQRANEGEKKKDEKNGKEQLALSRQSRGF